MPVMKHNAMTTADTGRGDDMTVWEPMKRRPKKARRIKGIKGKVALPWFACAKGYRATRYTAPGGTRYVRVFNSNEPRFVWSAAQSKDVALTEPWGIQPRRSQWYRLTRAAKVDAAAAEVTT